LSTSEQELTLVLTAVSNMLMADVFVRVVCMCS